jgi:hypothetical protein
MVLDGSSGTISAPSHPGGDPVYPAGFDDNVLHLSTPVTPPTVGTFTYTIVATTTAGSINVPITATIAESPPVITSGNAGPYVVGVSGVSYNIVADDGLLTDVTGYGASGLPAGLTLNLSSGNVFGTPTVAGPVSVELSATNSAGTGHKSVTFTISSTTPVITSPLTLSGTVGSPITPTQVVSTPLATLPSVEMYSVDPSTPLPFGLSINSTTGIISGTPTTAGTYSVTLQADNGLGQGTGPLVITITEAAEVGITIIPSS